MKKFGAQYVVYEDSGFLTESVLRIYPLMEKIVFLVGGAPWNGTGDRQHVADTLNKISALPDPDKKFIIVSKYWKSEADTRNEGLAILHAAGCEWCMTIDDDEMYNRDELAKALETISNWQCTNGTVCLWMVPHLIYWRNRTTVADPVTGAMPVFVSTNPREAGFTDARNVWMGPGTVWMSFQPSDLLLHHFSYVRSDAQMKRKLASFSHAHQIVPGWYENVWLKWAPWLPMTDLHPTNPGSFKKIVPVTDTPYRLEPIPQPYKPVSVQQDPAVP